MTVTEKAVKQRDAGASRRQHPASRGETALERRLQSQEQQPWGSRTAHPASCRSRSQLPTVPTVPTVLSPTGTFNTFRNRKLKQSSFYSTKSENTQHSRSPTRTWEEAGAHEQLAGCPHGSSPPTGQQHPAGVPSLPLRACGTLGSDVTSLTPASLSVS